MQQYIISIVCYYTISFMYHHQSRFYFLNLLLFLVFMFSSIKFDNKGKNAISFFISYFLYYL